MGECYCGREKLSFWTQPSGRLLVGVDTAPTARLNAAIPEIRERYEGLLPKNH